MSGRLHADQMLARAESETGLSDYGDPTLPQRFGLVIDPLNTLSPLFPVNLGVGDRHR